MAGNGVPPAHGPQRISRSFLGFGLGFALGEVGHDLGAAIGGRQAAEQETQAHHGLQFLPARSGAAGCNGVQGRGIAQQMGFAVAVGYIVFKAMLAIGLWGAAVIGFLRGPMSMPERLLAALAAMMLIAALPLTDEIGFALAAAAIALHWYGNRSRAARGTARSTTSRCGVATASSTGCT